MNREIKFRGKRIDSKEWVYGVPVKSNYGISIVSTIYHVDCAEYNVDEFSVIPETIGQFTGLLDKNGKEIYEGDLLDCDPSPQLPENPIKVGWSNKYASFVLNKSGWAYSHYFGEALNPEDCEIIGNIHDNPELIK